MADFQTGYQGILESSSEFLKNATDELTPAGEDRLENLGKLQSTLSGIITDEPESEQISQGWMDIARELCITLLFGELLGFITQLAAKAHLVREVESKQSADESIKLPQHMQVRVDKISGYVKKCEVIMEKIDNIMLSLIPKVREAKLYNFRADDRQLKALEMDVNDVKCELKKCKKYLDSAHQEFSLLKKDIEAEKWHREIKVAAIGSGAIAITLLGGAALKMNPNIANSYQKFSQHLVGKLAEVGLGIGVAVGATSIGLWIYSYIKLHDKMLKDQISKVESDLREAQADYETKEMDYLEKVEKYMKR